MRYLILVAMFTAAAMLPFTGWVLGRSAATPLATIVYQPASCLSSWGA
jgi:hypothetical protein